METRKEVIDLEKVEKNRKLLILDLMGTTRCCCVFVFKVIQEKIYKR